MLRKDDEKLAEPLKITAGEKLPSTDLYRRPSFARGSAAYKDLVRHLFQEQVIRKLQRSFRKKHHLEFKGKYEETLNKKDQEPITLRFLKEPVGFKFIEHARKMLDNKWTKLDFSDPDFIRNITKLIRLNGTNSDDYAAAIALLIGKENFTGEDWSVIGRVKCDADGGAENLWSPRQISYATPVLLEEFKKNVQTLPSHQKNYFYFNFSRLYEITFIWDYLCHPENHLKDFNALLYFYFLNRIQWRNVDEIEITMERMVRKSQLVPDKLSVDSFKNQIVSAVNSLKNPAKREASVSLLKNFIAEHAFELKRWLTYTGTDSRNKMRESCQSLVHVLLSFHVPISTIAFSPEFDGFYSSPLFCFVLPHPALLKVFFKTFFKENLTLPFYSLGQLSTRFIRDLEDLSLRPVELPHPDLRALLLNDGSHLSSFALFFHDAIGHVNLSNLNHFKIVLRYVRQLIERVKNVDMSKSIWNLADLSIFHSNFVEIRDREAKGQVISPEDRMKLLAFVMENSLKDIFYEAEIILADFILNYKKWQMLLGNLFSLFILHLYPGEIFKNMRKIIKDCPGKSISYYVLRYAVQRKSQALNDPLIVSSILIIDLLEQHHLLLKIFEWKKNNGLHFRAGMSDLYDNDIEKLSPKEMYLKLKLTLIRLVAANQTGKTNEAIEALAKTADIHLNICEMIEHQTILFHVLVIKKHFSLGIFLLNQIALDRLILLPRSERDFILNSAPQLLKACHDPSQEKSLAMRIKRLGALDCRRALPFHPVTEHPLKSPGHLSLLARTPEPSCLRASTPAQTPAPVIPAQAGIQP